MVKEEKTSVAQNGQSSMQSSEAQLYDTEGHGTTNSGSSKTMKKCDRSKGLAAFDNDRTSKKEEDLSITQTERLTKKTEDKIYDKFITNDYTEASKKKEETKHPKFFKSFGKFLFYLIIYMDIWIILFKIHVMALTFFSYARNPSMGVTLKFKELEIVCHIIFIEARRKSLGINDLMIFAAIVSAFCLVLFVIFFEVGYYEFTRIANAFLQKL